jgi:hypothetical protein
MLKRLVVVCIWLSLLLSAANLVPNFILLQEINRNFGCYYMALHLVTLVVLLFPAFEELPYRKGIYLALVSLCVFYATHIYELYVPPSNGDPGGCASGKCFALKALFVHFPRSDLGEAELAAIIEQESPTLVALVGAPAELSAFSKGFPYSVRTPQGLVLLSRNQLEGSGRLSLGTEAGMPEAIVTEVIISSTRRLQITVLDTFPLTDDALLKNKLLTRRLLTLLRHNDREGLLFASLHATPFSSYYGSFIWGGKFESAANGYGLWYTWDGTSSFKRFTLDHVLVRGFLTVTDYEVLQAEGMSHLPVLVEIATPTNVSSPWQMPFEE